MWIWSRMEKIAWTYRKTNVEVLEMLQEKQSIVKTIIGRKRTGLVT